VTIPAGAELHTVLSSDFAVYRIRTHVPVLINVGQKENTVKHVFLSVPGGTADKRVASDELLARGGKQKAELFTLVKSVDDHEA